MDLMFAKDNLGVGIILTGREDRLPRRAKHQMSDSRNKGKRETVFISKATPGMTSSSSG
jgi:hypothetical protein